MSSKTKYVVLAVLAFLILVALILGLTLGLRQPAVSCPVATEPPPPVTTTPSPLPWPPSATEGYRYAGVSTDSATCSRIGSDVLGVGGSAVDATIASGLCIGVVNHHSAGIGGGHFMIGYEKPRGSEKQELFTILAREWAPIAASQDMYVNDTGASVKGALSIGVPGEIKGFYSAWEKYGRRPWAELIAPSIKLCEDGFVVEKALDKAIKSTEVIIREDSALSELLVKPNGKLIHEGEILRNPRLAATLKKIAADPHSFYNGSLADDIVADIKERGGIITKEDLLKYETKEKDPVKVSLSNGGYTVYSPPPPSSGAIYQFMLNVLNGYRFNSDTIANSDDTILAYHRIIEAFKFAFAERSSLGDEDFVNVTEILANLTSTSYADGIRARINDTFTQGWRYYEPDFDIVEDDGTSHFNVQTRDGSAVAITSTINFWFGSKVRGSRTGIMFNDEMDDFSTPGTVNGFGVPSSPSNYIVPGKMPMSSMSPSLVLDSNDNIVFLSGAAGGTRIITTTAWLTLRTLWFNQSLIDAMDSPRIHHQLIPKDARYEPNLPDEVLEGLKKKKHEMTLYGSIAVSHSILNTCAGSNTLLLGKCIYASSDGRKGGAPAGLN